jgi:hypothetical protein
MAAAATVFRFYRFFGLRIAEGAYRVNSKGPPGAAVTHITSGTILKPKNSKQKSNFASTPPLLVSLPVPLVLT